MKITKAILPVAGKGTRVMPLTLHQPKGMIAIADKPMVHHVIDELVMSGIKEITIVMGPDQIVFKKYLNYIVREHAWNSAKINFAVQNKPLGDGDAIYSAKKFIKKGEPFLVAFCDDIFSRAEKTLPKILDHFSKKQAPVVMLVEVPHNSVNKYGVVRIEEKTNNIYSVVGIVEKPDISAAPSNLIMPGRYALPYSIFGYLEKLYSFHRSPEVRLANALELYINDFKKIWGLKTQNTRFDCGSKEGLIQAQAHFASIHPYSQNARRKILK